MILSGDISIELGPGCGRHPSRKEPLHQGQPVSMPPFSTLLEGAQYWAQERPNQLAFYFIDLENHLVLRSFSQILENSRRFGRLLHEKGVSRGDRVMISFDTCPELIEAFLGCQWLGAVPCLVDYASGKSWKDKLIVKMKAVGARCIVTGEDSRSEVELALGNEVNPFVVSPDDLVFIQFTSGTTSAPKAVSIQQRALLANVKSMGLSGQWVDNEVMVGWLPLFHDMGLVATTLSFFLHGLPTVLMPPAAFLLQPSRWFWAIHHFRGTSSFSPNFGYQLSIKRIQENEIRGLDLSSWVNAYNAAELIHLETIQNFFKKFSFYGFKQESMIPAYGMAEMVVGVACHDRNQPIFLDTISRSRLSLERKAIPVGADDPEARTLVGVGSIFDDHEIRIVNEKGQRLGDREEGEILLRGPSLAQGYFNNVEATSEVFREGWLWTGDLGYLVGDQLFICGRNKDLIIKAGENHHPDLLEHAASGVMGVRDGCVAAVGVDNIKTGTEDLIILFETQETDPEAVRLICQNIEKQVTLRSGVRPDRVLPVAPHSIPKTSSGKICRTQIKCKLHLEQI